MPDGELPPGCRGGTVGVGIKVALGLVLMVGVVPFDGQAICVLGRTMLDAKFPDRVWLSNGELYTLSIDVTEHGHKYE